MFKLPYLWILLWQPWKANTLVIREIYIFKKWVTIFTHPIRKVIKYLINSKFGPDTVEGDWTVSKSKTHTSHDVAIQLLSISSRKTLAREAYAARVTVAFW